MRVAGVRLTDGRVLWVHAGDVGTAPLDIVVVESDGAQMEGQIFIAPEQLVGTMPPITGRLVRIEKVPSQEYDAALLPGADLPPLGTTHEGGLVVRVDATKRGITLRSPHGEEITVSYRIGR